MLHKITTDRVGKNNPGFQYAKPQFHTLSDTAFQNASARYGYFAMLSLAMIVNSLSRAGCRIQDVTQHYTVVSQIVV